MENTPPRLGYTVLIIAFFTTLYVNDVVLYKLVNLHSIKISAASLIFPITFLITDMVAEIYGYVASKRLIYLSVIFNIVFSGLIALLIYLPSPPSWDKQLVFDTVFKNIFFISLSHIIATPLGYLLNVYFMSKWKVRWSGRFFKIRSIFSSAIGEISFSAVMVFYIWHNSGYQVGLIELTLLTYASKVVWNIIGSYPAALMVKWIKLKDKTDVYDNNLKYTVF